MSAETPLPSRGRRILRTLVSVIIAGGLGTLGAMALYVPAPGWTSNDVTTGQHTGYPDLKPHRYDMPPDAVVQYAATVASRLPGWHVIKTDTPGLTIQAEAKTKIPVFTNDVTVTVTPEGETALVNIRSRSRMGGGDLGENARHIRDLQTAMDQRLPLASP